MAKPSLIWAQKKRQLALVMVTLAFGIAPILVAPIAIIGIAAVDANPANAASGSYAATRIATAFQVVAELPPVASVLIPLAEKGDLLPIGCAGPLRREVQAECIDTAFEQPSEPSVVMETRRGRATSELMRLESLSVAGY